MKIDYKYVANESLKLFIILMISYFINLFSKYINSDFDSVFDFGIIGLFVTLFAITVTSITFIAGRINELKRKYNYDFKYSIIAIKEIFIYQIVIIAISVIALIVKDTSLISKIDNFLRVDSISNVILTSAFIYYIYIIYDLSMALLEILTFNPPNNNNKS